MSYTWRDISSVDNIPGSGWNWISSDSTGKYLALAGPDIWTSSNNGLTWTNQTTGTSAGNLGYLAICSDSTGQNLAAVAYDKNIYTSTNYGVTWTEQTNSGSRGWSCICSDSTGQYLAAVVADGNIYTSIYTSNDYGVTWTEQTNAGSLTWYGICSDSTGQNLAAVAYNENIYTSTNYGVTWTAQTNSGSRGWYSICSDSTGQYLAAVVDGGNIYTSTDYGVTWTAQTNAPLSNWWTICSDSTGRYLAAVVKGGNIWISSNYGVTWVNQSSNASIVNKDWSGICSNSTSTQLVSIIYQTNDGIPGDIFIGTQSIVCFKEDTKILTDQGYKPVQDLRKGDLVKTMNQGFLPIVLLGKKEIHHPASKERTPDQLYKCSKDEYPEVFEDLIITGSHSILVDCLTQEQGEKTMEDFNNIYETDNKVRLCAYIDNRASIYEIPGNYTIYHLALENENYTHNYGIYANGLLVESCSKRYLMELSNMDLIGGT